MRLQVFLLLFFVFSFLFRTDHSFDQDLGRHIKLGEIITKTGQIPKNNLFSYTNPDFPFINTHWLFEVLAYWFSQSVGLQALLVLKVIILLFSCWLILKIIPKQNSSLLLPIGFIFLHVLRERLELRPEIFSFLFTALTYYILEKYLKTSVSLRATEGSVAISHTEKIASSKTPRNDIIWSPIFLLPAIQLLWINTHIYFFVGLLLQAIFLIPLLYYHMRTQARPGRLKTLAVMFGLSVAVSLINPNGLAGLLYPLNVFKNYGYAIVENQTMFFLESINFRDPNFIFVKLSIGIIALSLVTALIRRNFELKNILLAVSGVILALMNVRSFPYLVFLSLPATLANFSPGVLAKPSPKWMVMINTVIVIILLWESWLYLRGDYYKSADDAHQVRLQMVESIKGAMDFVQAFDLPNPIFNNFDIGSYIIYRGYPKYRVFVDGRPEAYPAQFFSDTYIPIQADYAKFKQKESEVGFKTVIFSHTDQTPWGSNFLQSIVKDQDWKLVFIDDFTVVFVNKDAASPKNLKVYDLANLNPKDYKFDNHVSYLRLGLFLLKTQNTQAGRNFLEKAAQIYPKSPVTASFLTL